MNLRWVEVDHAAVVRIALAANLSTYDASYLQLARALGAPLLTFDQKLLDPRRRAGDSRKGAAAARPEPPRAQRLRQVSRPEDSERFD
jgi:hypothetical protein